MPTLFATLLLAAATAVPAGGRTSLDVQPARFDASSVRQVERRIRPLTADAARAALVSAKESRDPERVAAAAAEVCAMGNPGGQACADAERNLGNYKGRIELLGGTR